MKMATKLCYIYRQKLQLHTPTTGRYGILCVTHDSHRGRWFGSWRPTLVLAVPTSTGWTLDRTPNRKYQYSHVTNKK